MPVICIAPPTVLVRFFGRPLTPLRVDISEDIGPYQPVYWHTGRSVPNVLGKYQRRCGSSPFAAAVQQCGIQGACQHCDDQVLMVEGLRVHGCVRPIHKIVPATPDGLVQYMHDATIR